MRRQWLGFILTWASAFPTAYPILKFCLKRSLPHAITKSSPIASSRIRDSRRPVLALVWPMEIGTTRDLNRTNGNFSLSVWEFCTLLGCQQSQNNLYTIFYFSL